MSETDINLSPKSTGIDPELKVMLDYFGQRVESVTMEYQNGSIKTKNKVKLYKLV